MYYICQCDLAVPQRQGKKTDRAKKQPKASLPEPKAVGSVLFYRHFYGLVNCTNHWLVCLPNINMRSVYTSQLLISMPFIHSSFQKDHPISFYLRPEGETTQTVINKIITVVFSSEQQRYYFKQKRNCVSKYEA